MSSIFELVCGSSSNRSLDSPLSMRRTSPRLNRRQRLSKRRHRLHHHHHHHMSSATTTGTNEGEPLLSRPQQTKPAISKSNQHKNYITCRLCLSKSSNVECLRHSCGHKFCKECLFTMMKMSISESRVLMECPLPECDQQIHPSDIYRILLTNSDDSNIELVGGVYGDGKEFVNKYEQFMVRRVLQSIQDTRWCPAPDCHYAVIGSPSCPIIHCLRPYCNTSFCYFCKKHWHPNKICHQQEMYENRSKRRRHDGSNGKKTIKPGFMLMKRCPNCSVPIMKMEDGSCNHMTCSMCNTEFCWLCNKVISDLHFLSPTGCTFWGRKRWSRRKKIIWQCMALLGAPVAFVVLACVSIPTIIVGLPFFTARKVYKKLKKNRFRSCIVTATACGAALASPAIAAVAVAVCIPLMLTYTYGIIPILLLRRSSENGGPSNSNSSDDLAAEDVIEYLNEFNSVERSCKLEQIHSLKLDVKDASTTEETVGTGVSPLAQLPVGSVDDSDFVDETTATSNSLANGTVYESCIKCSRD
ncbi:hypothetical protein ACOME3_005140 [Neoechinorhynchus agilis]